MRGRHAATRGRGGGGHGLGRRGDGRPMPTPPLRRLSSLGRPHGTDASRGADGAGGRHDPGAPPPPPLELTPQVACDPSTDPEVLWRIARDVPELRRWVVANPSADAMLLEYVSQAGGPGVRRALEVLLDSLQPPARSEETPIRAP